MKVAVKKFSPARNGSAAYRLLVFGLLLATALALPKAGRAGTLSADGDVLTVTGTHDYKKTGKYKVRVEVLQTTPNGSHTKVARVLALIQTDAVVA